MSLTDKIGTGLIVLGGLGVAGSAASCEYHYQCKVEHYKDADAIEERRVQIQKEADKLLFQLDQYRLPTICTPNIPKDMLNEKGLAYCAQAEGIYQEQNKLNRQSWSKIDSLRHTEFNLEWRRSDSTVVARDHAENVNWSMSSLILFGTVFSLGSFLTYKPSRKKEENEPKDDLRGKEQ